MTDSQALLLVGTEALAQGAWQQARNHFEAAIAAHESPEAHDGLSCATWWLNDAAAVIRSREAAYRLYRQRGDDLAAARMAMWAGCDHIDFHGDVAVGRGWLSSAGHEFYRLHGDECGVEVSCGGPPVEEERGRRKHQHPVHRDQPHPALLHREDLAGARTGKCDPLPPAIISRGTRNATRRGSLAWS